jgi:hypothetical protein
MQQAGGIFLATKILLKITQPVLAFARILVGGDGLEPPTSCV